MRWEAISTYDGFAFVLLDSKESIVGLCCVKSEHGRSFQRRSKHLKELDNGNFFSIGETRLSLVDSWVHMPEKKHVFTDPGINFSVRDPDWVLNSMVGIEKLARMWDPTAEPTGVTVVFEILKMVEAFFESFDTVTKKRVQVLENIMET